MAILITVKHVKVFASNNISRMHSFYGYQEERVQGNCDPEFSFQRCVGWGEEMAGGGGDLEILVMSFECILNRE